MVGASQRKVREPMRKNSVFFLGAVAGTCLTLLVTGPRGEPLIAAAMAAASPDTYSKLNLFGEVFERVRADYVEKPDDARLVEAAINGMVTSLDPHSRYMNDKAWREMQETTHGEFGGLGIEVTMEDGLVKVVAPMDDTPAAKAGIMSGDLITHINGEAVQGLTLEQAVNKMKGPVNTKTRLKIIRKGAEAPIEVSIEREIIRVRPVRYHTEGGDIGYIRITTFNEQTTDGLKKAIADISKQIPPEKLAGYVVDLRNNPGGLLDQAVSVSAAFMARGEVVSTRGRTRRGNPALHGAERRSHQGQAAGRPDQWRIGLRLGDRGRRVARPQARDPDRDPLVRQGLGADHHPARRRQRRIGADHGALFYAVRPIDPGQGHHARYRGAAGRAGRIEGPLRNQGRGVDARPSLRRRRRADRARNPTFRRPRRTTRRLARPTTCCAASPSMPACRRRRRRFRTELHALLGVCRRLRAGLRFGGRRSFAMREQNGLISAAGFGGLNR